MSTTYDLLYRGVSKENNIRYLTAETPPTDDNSNKVPTTEWVKDALEVASSGAYPTISKAVQSGRSFRAPSGGTWWVFSTNENHELNNRYVGGAEFYNSGTGTPGANFNQQFVCIKIA